MYIFPIAHTKNKRKNNNKDLIYIIITNITDKMKDNHFKLSSSFTNLFTKNEPSQNPNQSDKKSTLQYIHCRRINSQIIR